MAIIPIMARFLFLLRDLAVEGFTLRFELGAHAHKYAPNFI